MGICGGTQAKQTAIAVRDERLTNEFQKMDVVHRAIECLFIYEYWLTPKLISIGTRKSKGWFNDLFETTANGETKIAKYTRLDDGSMQVIVCGTTNVANVLSDMEFMKREYNNTGVHFHDGFLDIAEDAFAKLEKYFDKAQDISITGHSLGGGVSVILGWILHSKGYKVREIVTFGQPRVTSKSGVKTIGNALNLWRVVNFNDVVTSVPKLNYTHFGELLWMTDSLRKEPTGFPHIITGVKYHSIVGYITEVLKHCTYLTDKEVEWAREALKLVPVDDDDRKKKEAEMKEFMEKARSQKTVNDEFSEQLSPRGAKKA